MLHTIHVLDVPDHNPHSLLLMSNESWKVTVCLKQNKAHALHHNKNIPASFFDRSYALSARRHPGSLFTQRFLLDFTFYESFIILQTFLDVNLELDDIIQHFLDLGVQFLAQRIGSHGQLFESVFQSGAWSA